MLGLGIKQQRQKTVHMTIVLVKVRQLPSPQVRESRKGGSTVKMFA